VRPVLVVASSDVSYLPDLKAYLHDLLRDRERVLAATELDDWARTQALPSEEKIRRIRTLIGQAEAHLGMPQVRQPAPDLRLERTS
jgi:hypothetical protein